VRLLVTGGAGNIGQEVVEQLVNAGHQVVVLDNLSRGCKEQLNATSTLCVGDIGDRTLLDRILPGIDGVIHLAAFIEVGESMAHPNLHFHNNAGKTMILLEAMLEHQVPRFIFSSTAAVYGMPEKNPVDETHPLRPTNPYGESKLMVERTLHWLHERNGLRYASLRYFNAAGGRLRSAAVNLIPIAFEVAQGTRPHLKVFGTDYPTRDGTAIRDYIHVRDLASAHLMALAELEKRGRLIYNLGNGIGFSVKEVVETVRRVTGHEIPVLEAPRRDGDAPVVVASSELIKRELGWSPLYSDLEMIVRSAWALTTTAS
jgi:UDP-glucose 4-epimerase